MDKCTMCGLNKSDLPHVCVPVHVEYPNWWELHHWLDRPPTPVKKSSLNNTLVQARKWGIKKKSRVN